MKIQNDFFRRNLIYKWWFNYKTTTKQKAELDEWQQKGRTLPPPHAYKQSLIIDYSSRHNLRVFVETGTFMGYMVEVMKYRFKRLFSIELDRKLWENAKLKFATDGHVSILQGDSTNVLPEVLRNLNEPALFWLDGHFSEGITAKGLLNTPIISELKSILTHHVKKHVILVDDARCFTGKDDYPTIDELRTLVLNSNPTLSFKVENDIVVIHS